MPLCRSLTCVVTLFLLVTGCASSEYVHAVYFTFKPDTPTERIDAMVDGSLRELGRIPGVRRVSCGRRDRAMTRTVNDTAFDVGLIIRFTDRARYEAYCEHPIHMAQVEKYKDMIAAMRVFDFEVTNETRAP